MHTPERGGRSVGGISGGWISTIDIGALGALGALELRGILDNMYEMNPCGRHVALDY
jgi:hypothetical protein